METEKAKSIRHLILPTRLVPHNCSSSKRQRYYKQFTSEINVYSHASLLQCFPLHISRVEIVLFRHIWWIIVYKRR